jgi:predicted component of type VI protein secretion system
MAKTTADTKAIIAAIEVAARTAASTAEVASSKLQLHTAKDEERFEQVTALVESIANDVKSLLDTRSFTRGAWKAITVISLSVSTAVGLVFTFFAYLKGH